MQKKLFVTGLLLIAATGTFIACSDSAAKQSESKPTDQASLVKRGEYLVNTIGCDDCHSPKKMGPQGPEIIEELRFSGYPSGRPIEKADTQLLKKGWSLMGADLTATAGMWGMSFAANITPDETGIGNWKEEQFIKALREGKYKGLDGSRPILPPMPWMAYKNLTDEDLRSIFAYLKSVKPVSNAVPPPVAWKDLE